MLLLLMRTSHEVNFYSISNRILGVNVKGKVKYLENLKHQFNFKYILTYFLNFLIILGEIHGIPKKIKETMRSERE